MDSIVNMVRNGYARRADGSFVKLLEFPNGKEAGNGMNHHVERIVRNRAGQIIAVESQNKRN
jgi:hypothetical protein